MTGFFASLVVGLVWAFVASQIFSPDIAIGAAFFGALIAGLTLPFLFRG